MVFVIFLAFYRQRVHRHCPTEVRITLKGLLLLSRIASADIPVRITQVVIRIKTRNAVMRTIPEITETKASKRETLYIEFIITVLL